MLDTLTAISRPTNGHPPGVPYDLLVELFLVVLGSAPPRRGRLMRTQPPLPRAHTGQNRVAARPADAFWLFHRTQAVHPDTAWFAEPR